MRKKISVFLLALMCATTNTHASQDPDAGNPDHPDINLDACVLGCVSEMSECEQQYQAQLDSCEELDNDIALYSCYFFVHQQYNYGSKCTYDAMLCGMECGRLYPEEWDPYEEEEEDETDAPPVPELSEDDYPPEPTPEPEPTPTPTPTPTPSREDIPDPFEDFPDPSDYLDDDEEQQGLSEHSMDDYSY